MPAGILDSSTSAEGHALLGLNSKTCCLPRGCMFEPLQSPHEEVQISDAATGLFAAHSIFGVPCDPLCAAGKGRHRAGLVELVHKFTLEKSAASPLNHRLLQWSLDTERLFEQSGVSKSNLGGYQSSANLFVSAREDPGIDRLLSSCRVLHGVVSAACEEVLRPDAPNPAGELHEACAWLNVNRGTDSNLIHIHDPNRFSAVYFVQAGTKAASPNGHLVFRGGCSSPKATHTYLAVPPEPGTLWLFPGSIPHCVLPQLAGAAAAADERQIRSVPRVSVAINLRAEAPLPVPPRPRANAAAPSAHALSSAA